MLTWLFFFVGLIVAVDLAHLSIPYLSLNLGDKANNDKPSLADFEENTMGNFVGALDHLVITCA